MEELQKIFWCLSTDGNDAVCKCANTKLSLNYNGSFMYFLDAKKHYLFHQLDGASGTSCLCNPAGCRIRRQCKMEKWKFKTVYDKNSGSIIAGHVLQNGSRIMQDCLHQYNAKQIKVEDLDISVLSFLLKYCLGLSTQENEALDELMSLRHEICHLSRNGIIYKTIQQTENLWNTLEKALLPLVDQGYKNTYKTTINKSKRINLYRAEIDEVKDMIAKCLQKIEAENMTLKGVFAESIRDHMTAQVNAAVEKGSAHAQQIEANIKREILEVGSNLETHVDQHNLVVIQKLDQIIGFVKNIKVISYIEPANQRTLVDLLRGTRLNEMHLEGSDERTTTGPVDEITQSQDRPKTGNVYGLDIYSRCQIEDGSKHETEKGNEHEAQKQTDTRTMSVKITADSLTDQAEANVMEYLPVEDENEIHNTKTDDINDGLPKMKIVSKRRNCIYLELVASPNVFTNTETLRSAILEIVREVLIAGRIDTSVEDVVHVEMSFDLLLTKREYDVVLDLMSHVSLMRSQTDADNSKEVTHSTFSADEIISNVDQYTKQKEEQQIDELEEGEQQQKRRIKHVDKDIKYKIEEIESGIEYKSMKMELVLQKEEIKSMEAEDKQLTQQNENQKRITEKEINTAKKVQEDLDLWSEKPKHKNIEPHPYKEPFSFTDPFRLNYYHHAPMKMDSIREVEEKRRENFYKSASLFVDVVAKCKRLLLQRHISSTGKDFATFLNDNKHKLLHMCYNTKQCFECNRTNCRYEKILYPSQLETMFNKMGPYNEKQNSNVNTINFCCYVAKDNISVDNLDITLLRILLVNCCTDTLWASCLQDVGKTEPELLNEHKHDLFHMWKKGIQCCCCDGNNIVLSSDSEIEEHQWYAVFSAARRPLCDKTLFHVVPDHRNICVREAGHGIDVHHLTQLGLSAVILNNFCAVKKAIDEMARLRNVVYAHALKAQIEDDDFFAIWTTATTAILKVAKTCREKERIELELIKLKEEPLNVLEAERQKAFILKQISDNCHLKEEVIEELRNFSHRGQRSFAYLEEDLFSLRTYIDDKFMEISQQNYFVVQLLLEHGKYNDGQFANETNKRINNDEGMQNNDGEDPWQTHDDQVHTVPEADNQFICGQCHARYNSLDRFVSHCYKRCNRQMNEDNRNTSGLKWIAEIVLTGANIVFENMNIISLSDLAWSGITTMDSEPGLLILWVEIDAKYVSHHASVVGVIDKFLQCIFRSGVLGTVKTKSHTQLDIYVRIIDRKNRYIDHYGDKFKCGLCTEEHHCIDEYLDHRSKCRRSPKITLVKPIHQESGIHKDTTTPEDDPMFKERIMLLDTCKKIIKKHPAGRPLNIVVIGPRRCGKSSFLNTVFASLNSTDSNWNEIAEIGEIQSGYQSSKSDHVTWYLKGYAKKYYYNPIDDEYPMPTFYDMSGLENGNSDQIKTQLDLLFSGHIDINKKTSEVLQHGVDYGVREMRKKYKRKVIDKIDRIIVVCTSNPSVETPLPNRLLLAIREVARERDKNYVISITNSTGSRFNFIEDWEYDNRIEVTPGNAENIRTYGVFTYADKYNDLERENRFLQLLGLPRLRFASVKNYCEDVHPSYFDCIIPTLDVPALRLMKQVLTPQPNDHHRTDSTKLYVYTAFIVVIVAYVYFAVFGSL